MKKILEFFSTKVFKQVGDVVDDLFTNEEERLAARNKIFKVLQDAQLELQRMQTEIIVAEAKGNWFQSSWRPLIGWICGLSLAINYMVAPILGGFGITIYQADMSVMMPLLFGMLGISGLRSFDKMKKTDTKK